MWPIVTVLYVVEEKIIMKYVYVDTRHYLANKLTFNKYMKHKSTPSFCHWKKKNIWSKKKIDRKFVSFDYCALQRRLKHSVPSTVSVTGKSVSSLFWDSQCCLKLQRSNNIVRIAFDVFTNTLVYYITSSIQCAKRVYSVDFIDQTTSVIEDCQHL